MAQEPSELAGNAFGLPDTAPAGSDEPDPLVADLETPPEPQPPPPQEEPEPPAEFRGEQPPPKEEPAPPPKLAGRFESVEDLEHAYKSLQGEYTRSRQELADNARQIAETRSMLDQYQPFFQQMQRQSFEDNPELAQQFALQQLIDQRVQQRVQPLVQEQAVAAQQQQQIDVILNFRQAHPDVAPNSPEDVQLASIVESLDLDISNPDSLEIAYEALKSPPLRSVLVANPEWVETDEALEYARAQARVLEPHLVGTPQGGTPAGGAQPQPAPPQQVRRPPHVERAGGTPPGASSDTPQGDEFDDVLRVYAKEKSDSVFFGGLPPGTPSR